MTHAADDDVLPDLPPIAGSLDEDEPVGVDDAVDVAMEVDTEGEEDIGLDDSTAGAEVYDIAELLGEATDRGEDEGERWTEGTEAAGELVADDGLRADEDGEEYGWTEGTDEPGIEGWDDDVIDEPDEPSMLGADAGEEGVDEDFAVRGGEDDVDLPPIAVGAEGDDLADDLDLAEEGEIEGVELSYEDEARLSGAALPAPIPPAQVAVAHFGPADDALAAIAIEGEALFAGGERLYVRAGAIVESIDTGGLDGHDVTSIVIDPRDPSRLIVGTRLGGAFRSTDGGRSFTAVNGWLHGDPERLSVAFFVTGQPTDAAGAAAHGARVWGRTRAGVLYRSDDFGDTWSSPLLPAPVAALGADATAVVALCVPRAGGARVALSTDGGHAWTVREVPGLGGTALGEADHHVAVLGDTIVVVRENEAEGPFVSRDAGASWARLGQLPSAGAVALVKEQDRVALYTALFFDGADRGVLVRHDLDEGRSGLALDVRHERDERRIEGRGDPEGDNRVLALRALPRGIRTQVWAATGAGLFRIELKP